MLMIGLYTQPPSSGGQLVLDVTPFATTALMSTNVHGDEAVQVMALRPLADAFTLYNQSRVLYVGVFDGASLIWEGRLEDPALSAGASGSGMRAQALGFWRAFTDIPYTALWSDTSVALWELLTETDVASLRPKFYQFDTQNRINLGLTKNTTYSNGSSFGFVTYRIPDQSSRDIQNWAFDISVNLPTNWLVRFESRDLAYGSVTILDSITGTGALISRSYCLPLTTPRPLVAILLFNNTGGPVTYLGENNDAYVRLTTVRVTTQALAVDTTLSANALAGATSITVASATNMVVGQTLYLGGTNPERVTVTSVVGATIGITALVNAKAIGDTARVQRVLADDIARDLLSTTTAINTNQLSTTTSQIQSPALDLTDEIYEDRSPASILDYLASRGDTQQRQWEVGVGRGQLLYFRPQFSAARSWYVDVTDLTLARTLEGLANSAYGLYQDASGRALRTAASANAASVARYALTRRTPVPASTTSATLATTQRDTYITNHDDPLPRATVRFDAVYDAQGARWPLYLVRAGDTITVRNVPPSVSSSYDLVRTFRVTHTTYDLLGDTLSVEPDLAPPTIASMIVKQGQTT